MLAVKEIKEAVSGLWAGVLVISDQAGLPRLFL